MTFVGGGGETKTVRLMRRCFLMTHQLLLAPCHLHPALVTQRLRIRGSDQTLGATSEEFKKAL